MARFYNGGSNSYIGYGFAYDGINRLTSAQTYETSSWTSTNKYKVSSISYDQIGNITAFQRYGSAGTLMDNMTYAYHQGTNRLRSVSDAVASSLYASDLNNQRGNNYQYDGAGNMAEDFESGVAFTRYNTANLPTQMEKFKNPSGMVAWFTLDSTARDESNNANHATPMSVTYDSSGVRGLYGLKMNGTTTGYMYAADHSAYHVSQPSLEAWVKPASISTSQTIACMSISGAWSDGRGFYMDVTSAGYPRFIVGNASGSWKIVTSTVALSVGQWSHVAGTYDGANLRIFVNGVQAGIANIGSVTISYTPRANSGPNPSVFYVGIQHNANNTAPTYAPDLAGPFNGVIDEVKVYNRALTGPEILSLYHKNTRSIVYRYDHTGNRIMKQDADGLTTYYVLDAAGRTLAVVENSSVKTYNVNGLDQIGYVRPAVGWERYYHLKDHLGSIRVTLADDGTPRAWDDYYPFGMVMEGKSGVSGSPDTRYKFTGKEQDTETGYDYFGARYYDARIGRWLAADPLADMYPAASAYQYALNDPIVHIDPDGRKVRNRHHAPLSGLLGLRQSRDYYRVENAISILRSTAVGNSLYLVLDALPIDVNVGNARLPSDTFGGRTLKEVLGETRQAIISGTIEVDIDFDKIERLFKSILSAGQMVQDYVDPSSAPAIVMGHEFVHAETKIMKLLKMIKEGISAEDLAEEIERLIREELKKRREEKKRKEEENKEERDSKGDSE